MKRRRGEAVEDEDDAEGRPFEAEQEVTQRNGRHTAHKRVQAVPGKDVRLDLGRVGKPHAGKLDLMAVDGKSARRSVASTPPSTPNIGARGSGRVRTPSVLLSSHPGEKVPALKANPATKNRQVAYCLRIVKELLRLKDGFGFSKPIDQLWDRDQLPGYFEMITSPMDLLTVQKRLEAGHYMKSSGKNDMEEVPFNVHAFSSDMRLIFNNAHTYNREGDVFFEAATRLREKFDNKIAQMPSLEQLATQPPKKSKKRKKGVQSHSQEDEKKAEKGKRRKSADAEGSGPTNRRAPGKKKAAGGVGGKSKRPAAGGARKKSAAKTVVAVQDVDSMTVEELEARVGALERQRALTAPGSPAASPSAGQPAYLAAAQALYNVEMSFQEKLELSENVGQLPGEKLRKVISMVTKNRDAQMEVNKDEEILLDIESMNNETLRDMQAFVNQTLFKNKKGSGPNGDVYQMTFTQAEDELEKLRAAQRKRARASRADDKEEDHGKIEKQRSFYDGDDSSSESDSDDSGSDDDDSSSDESGSSEDESSSDFMRKTRERNLAHQQAMQAAGTPLPSPPYQGGS